MEPGERKVEPQDDARTATPFPSKKERRARRKRIVDMINKYSAAEDLRRKCARLEKEVEKLRKDMEDMEQSQHTISTEKYSELEDMLKNTKEDIKAVNEALNKLIPPNSEDPGIKKPQFFFLRDKEDRPVICICDIVCFGQSYRGIAITSPLEFEVQYPNGRQKFCKATGRKIAFDRAVAAIMASESFMPVRRPEPREVLASVGIPWVKRGEPIFKAQVGTSEIDKEIAAAFKPRR